MVKLTKTPSLQVIIGGYYWLKTDAHHPASLDVLTLTIGDGIRCRGA